MLAYSGPGIYLFSNLVSMKEVYHTSACLPRDFLPTEIILRGLLHSGIPVFFLDLDSSSPRIGPLILNDLSTIGLGISLASFIICTIDF
jgi:hypothetical protein